MSKTSENGSQNDAIAIIGMAGRFPGASDVESFWANIRDGVDSIRTLSDEELIAAGVSRAELADPDYVKACPVLDDVDQFDAAFFGFSPRDASVMDPAHRIFLELAWHAVEHSGYTALPQEGTVGVFAAAGAPLYMAENLRSNPELMRSMGEFLIRHTGNDMNFLATRVSYEMDLRGPSLNIQTACSSALVSVHMACQSLLRGDCSMALAGGATVLVPTAQGYLCKEGEILSPDGRCRPFDAKSAGTVFGSGAGVVVLKRLSDALDDGDTIHAVIKGSAVNNDGALRVGYLAPGVDGQAAAVGAALSAAGVSAESISYVEAHGTGTLVGDPIELEALTEAYRAQTDKVGFCAVGSVKSNIGHLGEAASAASLIKAVMALKHRQLPPSLGYESPNPAIDFETSPFFVNSALRPWVSNEPLRCGVTALGAGGTNCHMILEEPPPALPGEGAREQQLLVLSAKTKTALDQAAENLAQALEADPEIDLADAAYTLAVGRRAMPHRRVLAARDTREAIERLRDTKGRSVDQASEGRPLTVFMFPGGGAQYARMGIELYEQEPVYQEAVDTCLALIEPSFASQLRALMFAAEADVEAATRRLEQPLFTLPSLFITEYAMARLFESWGASAGAYIGHSMGEYVAACLSGVFGLEDALKLVMLRGRLFEQVERGAMLSVPLSEAELRAAAPLPVDIAAVNAADLSVASGPVAAIEALEQALAASEIDSTRVRIEVAAHSAMLDPILGTFRELCRTIRFQPPRTPFISNVTGGWIKPEDATNPEYWVTHLRSTVRFADGLETLRSRGEVVLLEVGPGRTLCSLARAQAIPMQHVVNCMRHPQEAGSDLGYALTSLGRLWAAGAEVDWSAFYDGQLRNRIPLPTYPFERRRFWVEPGQTAFRAPSQELVKRPDIGDWFYNLGFSDAPLLRTGDAARPRRWLVISHSLAQASDLARHLSPDQVFVASAGRRFASKRGGWRFDFDQPEHYVELLRGVENAGGAPDHVVFIVSPEARAAIARNFLHPAYLAQALGGLSGPVQYSVVTSGLSALEGQAIKPESALALGPAFVSPRELDNLNCRCIDVPTGGAARKPRLMARLVDELRAEARDRLVVLREGGRWIQSLSPMALGEQSETAPAGWLRENGAYLITGGLGGVGLKIAAHMARQGKVRLALLSRSGLPDESRWDEIFASSPQSLTAERIAVVRDLRALGAEVVVVAGDVCDAASVRGALDRTRAAFGPLNGVIHAAGAMDDAPLMAKTREQMMAVLAPKVAGALALDALVREELDVFVVFSSVASYLGLPGQIDYAAANAFLDAFARARAARASGRTLVVNWNAWRDVGMAASAHRQQMLGPDPILPCAHPALDGYTDTAAGRTFATTFSVDGAWLLSEHRVKDGSALLPGTAYVELARAAFAEGREPGAIELSNLSFVAPFQVADDQVRRLSIEVKSVGERAEIAMRASGDPSQSPIVECEARAYGGARPAPLDLDAIGGRMQRGEATLRDGFLDQDFMRFGPRWANLRRVRKGAEEALVELALDDCFIDADRGYRLHPAVLDMATGGVQSLIPTFDPAADFYVPLGYGSVRIFGEMPARVFSHVRLQPPQGQELAVFDVTLAGADGVVFADITGFTMKRLAAGSAITVTAGARGVDQARNQAMAAIMREAIAPEEGLAAFDRIMAQPDLVQVIASSVDVGLWARQLDAPARGAGDAAPEGFQRPELDTDYAAPDTPVQAALAKVWSELLGVNQVGIHDNFFDLGGNSLIAVRLFAAVKKQFETSLPLAALFEAPTIAELSALLGDRESGETSPSVAWSPLVRIKAGKAEFRPIFAIHGSRGNVMNFKPLADNLVGERAVYGVQAQGVDGVLPPLERIEDMAASYVAAIRQAQPTGPYTLSGYSGGGVIAYEMAQQLLRAGEVVDLIVMLDTLQPGEMSRPISLADRLAQLGRVKGPVIRDWPRNRLDDLKLLEPLVRLRRIVGAKLRGRPVPQAPDPSGLEVAAMAVSDAYYRAQDAYSIQPYPGAVLVIRANQCRMHFLRAGMTLGWDKFVTGRLENFELDANHDSMLAEPAVAELARRLEPILARAEREARPLIKPLRSRSAAIELPEAANNRPELPAIEGEALRR